MQSKRSKTLQKIQKCLVHVIPLSFPACLLRLIKKSWSLQKAVEETFAEGPFVGKPPSPPSRDFSLYEVGSPSQSFIPKQFYSVMLEDESSQQKPPPCAEPSWSRTRFTFVSILWRLQPLMQMCIRSCKSAQQGEKNLWGLVFIYAYAGCIVLLQQRKGTSDWVPGLCKATI